LLLVKLKTSYFKSNHYNKKISNNSLLKFQYKPSSHIIGSLTFFNKKKIKIESFSLNSIWETSSKNILEFENLHNFLWIASLDIKTTKASAQAIIENWIDSNHNFNEDTWRLSILSKRLISWISNSNITLDESDVKYKEKFFASIAKQNNHLSKNVGGLDDGKNKLICCCALILIGLSFKSQDKFYDQGLSLLQKIIKNFFYKTGFPKSRNPDDLTISLKYLILIKEWIKESQNQTPDYLEEIIFNCGKSFDFLSRNLASLPLFNGSSEIQNEDFKKYLKYLNYNFNDVSNEKCGYVVFKDKKIVFIMDAGDAPEVKYSSKYQSGCLSFEIISNNQKIICNSGFAANKNNLMLASKSSAAHSTLYLNNHSSCSFKKRNPSSAHFQNQINEGLKIIEKKIINDKNFDSITASHNGYLKRYGYIHKRSIKLIKKEKTFYGVDNLIKTKNSKNVPYGIRFHIYPDIRIVKTKNSKSALLSLKNGEGWRFNCQNMEIFIEKGFYLGNRNEIINNENIFVSGMTNGENNIIEWSFDKIS